MTGTRTAEPSMALQGAHAPGTVAGGADFANWAQAPHNRVTFQRVQQFTRTARIARSPQASDLPQAGSDLDGLVFTSHSGAPLSVAQMLADTWTDGYLVMHKGRVVMERYLNGMRPDTLHLLMSCSKSVTATVAGVLVDDGCLETGRTVQQYVPELAASAVGDATVQQVLDMRTGLRFSEDYEDPASDCWAMEQAVGYSEPPAGYQGPRTALEYAASLTARDGRHGEDFHYQSILTEVLGLCMERASSTGFSNLVEDILWRPLGSEHEMVSIVDASGFMACDGGFNMCLRDFARFAQMVCCAGAVGERQLIPSWWIDECRQPGPELEAAYARTEYAQWTPGGAYHNQWWVHDPAAGIIKGSGIHGQALFIDPQHELVIAKFSSQPQCVDRVLFANQNLAAEAIRRALVGGA